MIYRLGEAEKALNHYKYSSPTDSEYIAKAQALQTHLSRCIEARNLRDWNTLLKEARCAISSGADSAPQVNHHSPIPLFILPPWLLILLYLPD